MKIILPVLFLLCCWQVSGQDPDDPAKPVNERLKAVRALQKSGRHAEAEPILRAALDQIIKEEGPDHPAAGIYFANLAWAARAQGRAEEAVRLYGEGIALLERIMGPTNFGTMELRFQLSNLLIELKRPAEALVHLEKLRDALNAAAPVDDMQVKLERDGFSQRWIAPNNFLKAEIITTLGDQHGLLNRKDEARQAFQEAQTLLRKDFAEEHPELRPIARKLRDITGLPSSAIK